MANQPPISDIAELVRSGQLDAAGALQMVQGELESGLQVIGMDEVDPEQERRDAESKQSRISALGHRLLSLAKEQVTLRQSTEERWYADVRQFNGQYDPGTFSDDGTGEQAYGSRVFVPLTRRLVNLCEARLFDILFQSGERNFVLKPTPVPDIDQSQQLASKLPTDQPISMPEGPIPAGTIHEAIKSLVEQAQKAADGMQREIDDQLSECRYQIHARNVIHDAILMGTGILKGPTAMYQTSKRWNHDPETNAYVMNIERRPVPVTARVDPWNFFPDMSAATIDECEFAFERHYLTKKQLSNLKNMESVDLDALRKILDADPSTNADSYRERLRSINGSNSAPDKRYEVWEYHGPLTAEDLQDCGCDVDDVDPLDQHTGIVWFCDGVVIKAALNPLDTGALPFRVFTWQKDESNIFGYGLPYEVRDSQVSANSAFRAMLDNMGLCVKPQVFVDDAKVEPMNGRWELAPGTFWRNKQGTNAKEAIQFIDIQSRLPELQSIFNASKSLIEEVGTLPAFMQGQDAPAAMQSATQASISWTAANLWVRRCVRNWDDDIVTPLIGDYYDWNMQYSDKEEIKGDSRVQALGISALMEVEGQAQKLQQFIQSSAALGVPPSNQMMLLRQFARAFKLDPDLVLPTDAEIAKMKEAESKTPPVNLDQLKVDVAKANNEMDSQSDANRVASKQAELEQRDRSDQVKLQIMLATIASNEKITMEEAKIRYGFSAEAKTVDLQDKQEQRNHEAQMFNAEAQLRVQTGQGI